MQEYKIFAIIVRTIGFVVLLYSTTGVYWVALKLFGVHTNHPELTIDQTVASAIYYVVIGLAVIRSADTVSRWAYKISN